MTLIEAIKSGRPFRRKGEDFWTVPGDTKSQIFSAEDVTACDWEALPAEPVVFETRITTDFGADRPRIYIDRYPQLIGKCVRLTIEEVPDAEG